MKLPHGFQPVSLEKLLLHFAEQAPTLGKLLFSHLGGVAEDQVAAKIV